MQTAKRSIGVLYNYLGASGLKVSNICLGTMTFGEHPGGRPFATEKESHEIMDRFAAMGGNFIDTADMYQNGVSESIVGSWLVKQDRSRFVIATKCGKPAGKDGPNDIGASRKHIIQSVDQCLKRLQTDYIDLFYIHVFDYGAPVEETLSTLNDLVQAGKIFYIGMSNAKGWQLQKMMDICKSRGWNQFVCLQSQYSLLCRSVEWEITEVCENEGVGLLPWSPLKGGWLAGKVKRGDDKALSGTRMDWASGRAHHSHPDFDWFANDERVWSVIDKCEELGKKYKRSVAQIALRWLLQRNNVPSVVIGVRTMDQLEDNMAAAVGWELTEEEMSTLNAASAIPAPYPYDYIPNDNQKRWRTGPK